MNLNNNVSNTNIVGAVKLANAAGGFTTGVKPDNKKVEPSNPFVIVGYILFASSIIVSIGIFLYSRYLDKRAISNLNEINKYSNEMKGVPLSDIHQLLSKLSAFSEVANKHAYLPAAFRFLETITIRNVFWKSFDYRVNEKNKVVVSLSGVAPTLYAVIQQMDEFKDPKYSDYISKVEFQGVTYSKKTESTKAHADFRVKFEINKPFADLEFNNYFSNNNGTSTKLLATTTANLIINATNTSITSTSSIKNVLSTNSNSQNSSNTKLIIKNLP